MAHRSGLGENDKSVDPDLTVAAHLDVYTAPGAEPPVCIPAARAVVGAGHDLVGVFRVGQFGSRSKLNNHASQDSAER